MVRSLLALWFVSLATWLPAPKAEKVVSIEGVTDYRFENGAPVPLFPDPSRPTVTVNATVFLEGDSPNASTKMQGNSGSHLSRFRRDVLLEPGLRRSPSTSRCLRLRRRVQWTWSPQTQSETNSSNDAGRPDHHG